MTSQTFEAFGFAEPLARALTQCGYATPTPIQVQALPPQLDGQDLIGLAETGSGKTAAFILPILQSIAVHPTDVGHKQVLSLILAPTRELALQIDQEVASLSRFMNIRRAVVLGGVSKGPQIHALKRGVHILVATPGRLLDHINMRSCDISGAKTLVIDEADRMFDMGFIRDIRKIVSLLSVKRRTALFSATMPQEIKKLAGEVLNTPVRVDVSSKQIVVDRIDQKVMLVGTPHKQGQLHKLLADSAMERVIVFARTKRGADRVASRLGMAGIHAVAFHGNKAQNARQRALADFAAGHVRVLVATDIAARGIDISNITHVVNFDMPNDPETYVHRVGRTARKGRSGVAISLCDPSEKGAIQAIERLMKQKIAVISEARLESDPALAAEPVRHAVHAPRDGARRIRTSSANDERKASDHRKGRGAHPKRQKERADSDRFQGRPHRNSERAEGRDKRQDGSRHGGATPFAAGSQERHSGRGSTETRKPPRRDQRSRDRSETRHEGRRDGRQGAGETNFGGFKPPKFLRQRGLERTP